MHKSLQNKSNLNKSKLHPPPSALTVIQSLIKGQRSLASLPFWPRPTGSARLLLQEEMHRREAKSFPRKTCRMSSGAMETVATNHRAFSSCSVLLCMVTIGYKTKERPQHGLNTHTHTHMDYTCTPAHTHTQTYSNCAWFLKGCLGH